MTLTLRIENFDSLPDGGPLSVTTTGQPLQVGRSASMDWTLPDPGRHISGHHFDISFRDGQYFLTDVSTNGVFLEGQRHRLEGAHHLQPGERFQVGHYFIVVALGDQPAQAAPAAVPNAPAAPAPVATDSDPWAIGGSPAAPIDPNPPLGPAAFEDFASDFISTRGAPPPPAAPIPAAPQPAPAPAPPAASGSSSPFDSPGPAAAPPVAAPVPPPAVPDNVDVLQAFCDGAGIKLTPGITADPEAFAFELGRTLRGASSGAMAMLNDRDTAKKFIKTGDRTMLSANPLKRLTDVNQALEVMFIQPREGFTSGGDALIEAMSDIHRHQRAIFAAIQPALIKLMATLAPEDIEEAVEGGLLSGGKRKAWDEFVKRWDGMTTEHENGMLDVFLAHFAESYGKASGGQGS